MSTGETTRLKRGELVGQRYRVERLLARGGFGETYLALDTNLSDRQVVIKILWNKEAGDADFRAEMQALAAIDHPGVVAPLEIGWLPNADSYLVMQFVEGSTLQDVKAAGPLPFARVASLLRQIGSALGAIHSRGILHRDLKPSNIMVQALPDGKDHVRIIDFGISRTLTTPESTSVQTIPIGSLSYMAPEQFHGRSSKASDIYAMAVIAFELVTGGRPFPVPGHGFAHPRGTPSSPRKLRPTLPLSAEALIMAGLSDEEDQRPSDAACYARALESAIGAAVNPAGHRRRRLIAVVTAFGLAIAGAISYSVASRWPSPRPTIPPTVPSEPMVCAEVAFRIRADSVGPWRKSIALKPIMMPNEVFQLEVKPTREGRLYILTEPRRPDAPLIVLFPSETNNNFQSAVPGAVVSLIPESSDFAFGPGDSADRVWIVWAESAVEQLENAARWARHEHKGVVGDPDEAHAIRKSLAQWERPMVLRTAGIGIILEGKIGTGAIDIEHR